ncbi:MAG: hypothetical protein QM775_30210 [Pirellulales bacterium]
MYDAGRAAAVTAPAQSLRGALRPAVLMFVAAGSLWLGRATAPSSIPPVVVAPTDSAAELVASAGRSATAEALASPDSYLRLREQLDVDRVALSSTTRSAALLPESSSQRALLNDLLN